MNETKRNTSTKVAGVVFTGCLMLGIGIGIYVGKTNVGMFIGAGVGFLLMGIIWAVYNKQDGST